MHLFLYFLYFFDHQQAFLIRSLVWPGLLFAMTWDALWYLSWSLLISGVMRWSVEKKKYTTFLSVLNLVLFFFAIIKYWLREGGKSLQFTHNSQRSKISGYPAVLSIRDSAISPWRWMQIKQDTNRTCELVKSSIRAIRNLRHCFWHFGSVLRMFREAMLEWPNIRNLGPACCLWAGEKSSQLTQGYMSREGQSESPSSVGGVAGANRWCLGWG